MSRSVTISIAGNDLAVRTDARPHYLRQLADHVSGKLEEARAGGKVVTTQKLALLAALGIADELFQLRLEHERLRREVRERARRIQVALKSEAEA